MAFDNGNDKMMKHLMIDIESTGIDPKVEDLLQVALLEIDFVDGYWHPGRSFNLFVHTDRKPTTEFALEHQQGLYDECSRAMKRSMPEIREAVLEFFALCGLTPPKDVFFAGWNASNFDVPFLVEKRVLRPPTYETVNGKDVMVGDFHYRVYELGGAVGLVQDVLQETLEEGRKKMTERALDAAPGPELGNGIQHDALYDCYRQTRILNGLIALVRGQR